MREPHQSFGFKSYDVSNPANPVLLDTFMPPGINPKSSLVDTGDPARFVCPLFE